MKLELELDMDEDRIAKAVDRALETAAQEMVVKAIHNLDLAGIKRQTGMLVSSIGYAKVEGGYVVCAGEEGKVDYAVYLEYGTGLYGPKHRAYEIVPVNKKALHWVEKGVGIGPKGGVISMNKDVFAKKVIIKGIHPVAFFRKAYEETLQELPEILKFELEREFA